MNTKNKSIAIFLIVAFMAVGVFSFHPVKADTAAQIQNHLDDLLKQQKEAQRELAAEQSMLYRNQSQISSTKALLNKLSGNIVQLEGELKNLNLQAELNKTMLAEYIRQLYYADQEDPIVKLSVLRNNLNEITMNFDNTLSIKTKIMDALQVINDAKTETEQAKAALADQQQNNQQALKTQQVQQAQIAGDVQETQATLAEIQQKMSQLQSDLNRILGKSYSTGDIRDAIQFAHKVTGVREGFLFGVLSMESGGNPLAGKCVYDNAGMSTSRKTYFKQICSELDYNYKKKPVSCASKSYPGSGGAMGAAQFMSDTWMGYKSRIASATGNNPPDPWSLSDGIVAMALKLKNDGATESGTVKITNPCNRKKVNVKWEIYASMKYLGWTCYGYTTYAPGIQSLAKGY